MATQFIAGRIDLCRVRVEAAQRHKVNLGFQAPVNQSGHNLQLVGQ